jgi:hypothetical protein
VLRRVFNIISALALLMCMATVVLWVRERSVGDDVMIVHNHGGPPWESVLVQGWSSGGGMRVVVAFTTTSTPLGSGEVILPADWTPLGRLGWYFDHCIWNGRSYPLDTFATNAWHFGGFQWVSQHQLSVGSSASQRSLTCPAWFPAVLFAILPAWSITSFVSRWRAEAHTRNGLQLCPTCGYDLL